MQLQILALMTIAFAGCYGNPTTTPKVPTFGVVYHARGQVKLPYAELDEPFEIFFNGPKNMGRIDFYNGVDKVISRGDHKPYGTTYKITPSVTGQGTTVNLASCFQVNGTKDNLVTLQSMLPDLKGFKYIGQKLVNGQITDAWQMVNSPIKPKVNTYSFYVTTTSPVLPVRYEMFGADTLLGSHYDKYYIDYTFFDDKTAIPASTFDPPGGGVCTGFPGPGVEKHIVVNPYRELINPELGDRYHQLFKEFTSKHGKEYTNDFEHAKRKVHFVHNVRFVHGVNRQGRSYTLGVNHLADRSNDELSMMRGRLTSTGYNGGAPFPHDQFENTDAPASLDWRLMGAVSQVKDQAICGSCWSFGSTEVIEGAYFKKNKKMVRFSQQNLMDCSWGFGNNACDGGEEWRSYQWIMKNKGLMSEEDYGAYLGQNGICHYNASKAAVKISKYVNVTSTSLKDLKTALVNVGPVAVGIDAHLKTFSFYASGVFYDKDCGNKAEDLDHAVLAVGYGTMKVGNTTQDYWIIKNSWSTYWGNNGYVLISQKDNNCGVATAATYVEIV